MADGEDQVQPQPEDSVSEQPQEQPLTGVGITILLRPRSVDLAGFQLHGNPNTAQFVALAAWLDAWAKMRVQADLQAILEQMNQRATLVVPNGHAKMPPLPPGLGPRAMR